MILLAVNKCFQEYYFGILLTLSATTPLAIVEKTQSMLTGLYEAML